MRSGSWRALGASRAPGGLLAKAWGVLSLVSALLGPTASAQVALDQFAAAPLPADGFALSRPVLLDKKQWGVIGVLDYARQPLVRRQLRGGDLPIVDHHLVLHAGFGIGVTKHFTGYAMLPVNLVMDGEDDRARLAGVDPADGAGLGDLAFGGRLRLYRGNSQHFALTGELLLRAPTARLANPDQIYSGDRIGNVEPALVTEVRAGRADIRLRGGLRVRANFETDELESTQALIYGAGVRVRLITDLYGHAELYGMSDFSDLFTKAKTPLELLVGPKYHHDDWFLGAAAGPGLVAGVGSPVYRVVASVGWAGTEKDTDGDGLLDEDDGCPLEPEDSDGFEDGDGCPDPDNDQDGLLDVDDHCPLVAEDHDGFEDGDGCPDPDNDQDGLLDVRDRCPDEAEDADGFEDGDGCPEPDNDRDGVLDPQDRCPLEPGPADNGGCPKVVVMKDQIVISDRVEFETGKATLLEESFPILAEVATVMAQHPELQLVRVEGHTDNVGKAQMNLTLSKSRAAAVVRWLLDHGVSAERLEGAGCGLTRPIADNETPDGRQVNRRVEFHIVVPEPKEPVDTKGCVAVPPNLGAAPARPLRLSPVKVQRAR